MNAVFEGLTVYLLVFVRMSGMILLNPLFARQNLPTQIRMVLVLALSLLIAPTLDNTALLAFSDVDYVLSMAMELVTGFLVGFVFQLFYYMLQFTGDLLDYQFGMSMSKVFDPGTNIQMSVSGTFLTVFFVTYLFATDSHLELIRMFAASYTIIPLGVTSIHPEIGLFFTELFSGVFILTLKAVIPFIVAEVTLEAAMGILMKLIPQITVFVINIQLKMLVGLGLLFLFAIPISRFVDNYILVLFQSMEGALRAAAA